MITADDTTVLQRMILIMEEDVNEYGLKINVGEMKSTINVKEIIKVKKRKEK